MSKSGRALNAFSGGTRWWQKLGKPAFLGEIDQRDAISAGAFGAVQTRIGSHNQFSA